MSEKMSGKTNDDHLFVLMHGLWGNHQHMEACRRRLHEKGHPILSPKSCEKYKSCDGVELCASRVFIDVIAKLEELGSDCKRISFIGYSFGGLILRYVVGMLAEKGVFETIEPVNFVTVATPHLGIRRSNRTFLGRLENALVDRFVPFIGGVSVREMSFRDSADPSTAMLSVLADANDIFIPALARFSNRLLLANARADRSVFYSTAALVESNPYNDLVAETHRAQINEHPRFVVRVVPHANTKSGHLDKYDILDSTTDNYTAPSKPSLFNRLLKLALVVPKAIGSSVLAVVILTVVVGIIFPISSIRIALQSRSTRSDLKKLGVVRRNASSLKRWFELRAPLKTMMPWNKARSVIDEKAPFSRVDVYLDGPNTHGTIIARTRAPYPHQGEHVMDYVFAKCLL